MNIVPSLATFSSYKDRTFQGTQQDWERKLGNSSTLYVGNLSFYTTEEQIYELFSTCGDIKRVVMGLDRNDKTPCGFCFVDYFTHEDALDCLRFLNGTKLDERIIRTDIDPGFKDLRQYGRGKSGGQVRDEFRTEFDSGRGGFGAQERERMERMKAEAVYDDAFHDVPSGNAPTSSKRRASLSSPTRNDGVDTFGRSLALRQTSKKQRPETSNDNYKRQRFDQDEDY